MIRIPIEYLWLAIITGGLYLYLEHRDVRFGNLPLTFILALIWSAWSLFIVISVGPHLTGPFAPDPPGLTPSPSLIRATIFTFMIAPTVLLLWFMVETQLLTLLEHNRDSNSNHRVKYLHNSYFVKVRCDRDDR